MLKMTTMAVLGLASGLAAAGSMGPVCTPGNVTVPCEAKQWDLGVQALYLKPLFSANAGYQFTNATSSNYGEINNDWEWGYRLEGSYHFNTGNDATVTWLHYKENVNGFAFNLFLAPQPFTASSYNAKSLNQLDQVNFVLGQHTDVSASDKLRFYGGFQYAHIATGVTNTATINPILGSFTSSDLKGVGPVVGIDYAYYLSNEFSLTANGSGSILYSKSRYSNGFLLSPPNVVLAPKYFSKHAVVPSLEAKLGVNYAYNIAQGVLNLQAGYQVLNYFNAVQTGGILLATPKISDSNYGLYGPYLGLKYVGNV